jgi:predicted nucleotidyltransferase
VTLSNKIQTLLHQAANTEKKLERQLYVAAAISGSFEEKGIYAVLVGGTVVEYYTAGGYTTGDVDMVLPPLEKREIERVMQELGFERFEDYRHWLHPKIPVPVEFPPGPLQIGHLPIQEVNEIDIGKIKLKILKVEDILLERLIMVQEWKDLQAQAQSEMLMDAHYVEMDWPYVHRKASELGILTLLQKIQKKVKQRLRNKK